MIRSSTAMALLVFALTGLRVQAFELPAVCAEFTGIATPGGDTDPLPELKARVEKLIETDPNAAVATMCRVIPRVASLRGEDSVDMAWWVGSLGTPLIAFMDRMSEAMPLLAFARPIFEKRLGPHAAEVAEIHVAYAWIATRQGRNVDAVTAWRSALRIREHNPGPRKIELQKVLVGLAQNLSFQRDFTGAKEMLARAEAILAENGEAVSEAAAAIENTYVNIAWREEDYASVRAHAEKQIRIEEQLPETSAPRVPAYVWLGQGLERLDEFEKAEAALRKAVEIAESRNSAPLQRHQFSALTQLAGLLVARGRPAEARDVASRAIALGEATRGMDAPSLVRPLQYLASAQTSLGELPEAMRLYERAGKIIEGHGADIERPWLMAHHRGLARLQFALGEPALAREALQTALLAAADDPKLATERAATLLALGTLGEDSALDAGRESIGQAMTLFRSRLPEKHPAILRAIADACALEIRAVARDSPADTGSCEEAERRVEQSTDVDPLLRHDLFASFSELRGLRGDPAAAYGLAIRALSAANTLGTPDPLWRADFALARMLQARGNTSLAIFFGKESITQIERLRGRFSGDERQMEQSFLTDKVRVYRTVADWLMSAGRIDEGLDVLRLLKAEELYDFVLRDAQWHRESGIELTPAEAAMREQYREVLDADATQGSEIERLGRLRDSRSITAGESAALSALLAVQGQQESARAARIRDFLAAGGPAATAVPLRTVRAETLARELASFGPDTALAFYLLTDDRLRVLIATRRGQFEYESPVDAPALRRDIGRFLEAIAKREDVTDSSRRLFELIARPVDQEARRAGAKRLVLWLDGALRYVPFAVLDDGAQPLVTRYVIESYMPQQSRTAEHTPSGREALTVRGLGLTQSVGGFEALPAMADELCDVIRGPIEGLATRGQACRDEGRGAGALDGLGFADASFTAERLASLLEGRRDFSVLHLGTHFNLRPGNARRSFLLLGDGSRLTLDTIAGYDFADLRLVTLSACQSGLGGATTDDGREIEGLSAIVQRRGAHSVLASLWRVEDRSTSQLMRELYRALPAQHGDAAAALRRAQLRLRATRVQGATPYAHPYYWAGFRVSSR